MNDATQMVETAKVVVLDPNAIDNLEPVDGTEIKVGDEVIGFVQPTEDFESSSLN